MCQAPFVKYYVIEFQSDMKATATVELAEGALGPGTEIERIE
jgi:hypothetical protein